jgi:methylenetetrahydrofolate dehydrogenase (NADP+)/methenyltetrahydrofolate cyclohydrolase
VSLAVGDEDAASCVYLKSQKKATAKVGIDFEVQLMPADSSEASVVRRLEALNRDASVHGIMIQRPLPGHLNPSEVIRSLDPAKDVEGVHPENLGCIVHGIPGRIPCTADAAVRLFRSTNLAPKGLEVVVVGHSEIVGKPIALLLVHELATVTICHIGTNDLKSHTRRADVLFVATGVPGLVRREMVKPGAAVIDIGINRTEAGLVGDVAFDEVREVAGWITPVPGGVGPVTTAVLLENTVR